LNAMMPGAPGHAALHVVCTEAIKRYRPTPSATKPVLPPPDAGARCARTLIDFGAAVNVRNADGSTPLMLALASLNQPLIDVLLDAGARPDLGSALDHSNAFHICAREGDARIMRGLLKKPNTDGVNVVAERDGTPLQLAALLGRVDVVAVLLDYQLTMSSRQEPEYVFDGMPRGLNEASVAMWLAAGEGQVDAVRYLARQGASIAASDGAGSILQYLAVHGSNDAAAAIEALVSEPRIRSEFILLNTRDSAHASAVSDALRHRDVPALAHQLEAVGRLQADTGVVGFDRRRSTSIMGMGGK